MARPAEELRFERGSPERALDWMRRLHEAGRGWVNFSPEVPEDAEVPSDGLFSFLSARGPAVPLCTWVAPHLSRGRTRPAQLGVQHATGTKAAARLDGIGLTVPTGWRVSQDHPRRGLVVDVAIDATDTVVLDWLLGAGAALCPIAMTGAWLSAVYDESA